MNADCASSDYRRLVFWSTMFFLIYVTIHIVLNLTEQGEKNFFQQIMITPLSKVVVEISGPITISVCSSLLIFTYGNFLIRDMTDISIAAPWAFFDSFILFVVGQILVQITGHLEIAINNYAVSNPVGPGYSFFAILSTLTYLVTFFCLLSLELYEQRVYKKLDENFPNSKWTKHGVHNIGAMFTAATILIIIVKFIIVFVFPSTSREKLIAVGISLLIEAFIVVNVLMRHRPRAAGDAIHTPKAAVRA